MGKSDLFRLVAPSRDASTLPAALNNFVLKNKEGTFSVPPLETLVKYRVIVSTCYSASVTYGMGATLGHFTHVFVDEAGQAAEPECMAKSRLLLQCQLQ